MSLWSQFLINEGAIAHKWKHYFPAYERHFGKFVNADVTFLEIGCGQGGSLQLWRKYLGPHARIIGIDIDPECRSIGDDDQIEVRIGDQSDTSFLASLSEEFGPFDVVLDDGSHLMSHIKTTFDFLYPTLSRNGVYFVEDLHTAYWSEYEGGYIRKESFIEYCKHLIDELNADWARNSIVPTAFTSSTLSMHFYDSIAVFEKGRTTRKIALTSGRPRSTRTPELFANRRSDAK